MYHVCVILFFYSVPTKVSEVRASVAVVDCVLHVQKCFSRMLTNMRQLSTKVDIKNVRFFLESILEADEFNTCKGFEDVLRLLRKSYIDAFNTSYLEQLAEYLEIDEINQLIFAYKRERDVFFKDPIVGEFQDAVFSKVELSGEDRIKVPEVRVKFLVLWSTRGLKETWKHLLHYFAVVTKSQLSKWMMSLSQAM